MKKYIGIALAVLMVLGLSGMAVAALSDTQTFSFQCTVDRHIEVNPSFDPMALSKTIPGFGPGTPPPPVTYNVSPMTWSYDAVYANCPFTITYAGTNLVPDGEPILAKLEVGNSPNYDRLQTRIQINNTINGQTGEFDLEYHGINFLSGPEGVNTGTWTPSSQTLTFVNYCHDGEVYVQIGFEASLPHVSPDFGVATNTWNQSADAGTYNCDVTATYTAL